MWIKQFNNTHFISKTNNTNINNFNIFHKKSIKNSENLNQNNEMSQMFAKFYTSIGFKEKKRNSKDFIFYAAYIQYYFLFTGSLIFWVTFCLKIIETNTLNELDIAITSKFKMKERTISRLMGPKSFWLNRLFFRKKWKAFGSFYKDNSL